MSIVIDYTKGFFDASPSGETVGDVTGNATLDLTSGNVFSYTPAANTTFVFSNPPASGTAYGFTLKVTGADVTSSYDLANASYDSVSFSVAGQETSPTGLLFKPDGTKMYVVGFSSDSVYQYSLSTAYDLSTASYDSVSLSVGGQDSIPNDIAFGADGTKMYVLGNNSDSVYQYSLSTAYDLSTASYDSVSFSVQSEELTTLGLAFKPDGTKMYVSGAGNQSVFQYSLSSGWDLSTASYDSISFSVAAQDGTPYGIAFSPSGESMYIVGSANDAVFEYSLSTAWDVSSATYVQNFSISSQDVSPTDLAFNSEGTKMYVVGNTNNAIYQYSTSGSTPATLTYPASVDWPAATAPTAPAAGETDVYTFYTTDGGTTYYGFQVGDAMA